MSEYQLWLRSQQEERENLGRKGKKRKVEEIVDVHTDDEGEGESLFDREDRVPIKIPKKKPKKKSEPEKKKKKRKVVKESEGDDDVDEKSTFDELYTQLIASKKSLLKKSKLLADDETLRLESNPTLLHWKTHFRHMETYSVTKLTELLNILPVEQEYEKLRGRAVSSEKIDEKRGVLAKLIAVLIARTQASSKNTRNFRKQVNDQLLEKIAGSAELSEKEATLELSRLSAKGANLQRLEVLQKQYLGRVQSKDPTLKQPAANIENLLFDQELKKMGFQSREKYYKSHRLKKHKLSKKEHFPMPEPQHAEGSTAEKPIYDPYPFSVLTEIEPPESLKVSADYVELYRQFPSKLRGILKKRARRAPIAYTGPLVRTLLRMQQHIWEFFCTNTKLRMELVQQIAGSVEKDSEIMRLVTDNQNKQYCNDHYMINLVTTMCKYTDPEVMTYEGSVESSELFDIFESKYCLGTTREELDNEQFAERTTNKKKKKQTPESIKKEFTDFAMKHIQTDPKDDKKLKFSSQFFRTAGK